MLATRRVKTIRRQDLDKVDDNKLEKTDKQGKVKVKALKGKKGKHGGDD